MTTVSRVRLAVAGLACAATVLAAGCGGDGAGGGGGLGSSADLAPASAALFAVLDTDFEGDQWTTAEELVGKFPGSQEVLDEILADMRADDVDFERDVKPAVGPELAVVVMGFEDDDAVVGLTQPRDEAKWRELLAKGDEPGVTEELEDGWWVAAESQEHIDHFKAERGDDSLGESDAFDEAMGALPEEALAALYVSGEALGAQADLDQLSEDDRALYECFTGGGELPSMAFAVSAEDDGARVSGAWQRGELPEVEEEGSRFADELPAGALGLLTMRNLAEYARTGIRCAADANEDFSRQLAQVELALGVSVEEDVLPLFEGETAFAVYPAPEAAPAAQGGAPPGTPSVTFATEVDDEGRAREVADKIADRASAFAEGVRVEDVEVGGVDARRVTVEDGFALVYAAFDGMLVVTTTEDGILALREEGARLADDEAYAGVREAADAPDEAAGIVYANVDAAVDLAVNLAETFGGEVDDEDLANLEPLRSLLLWGEAEDDVLGFEGFLQID